MTGSRTTDLLLQWHSGREDALHALLVRHLDWIRGKVTSQLGGQLRAKLESEDLVQEALLEFLHYGPRIRPTSGAQFRAVVSKIILNELRDRHDWFRAKRRDMAREKALSRESTIALSLSDALPPPDEQAAQAELEARIRLVIELMSPEDRAVLILRDWESKSFSEIAEELGVTADAVRMRYNRALPRLRKGLDALRRGAVDKLLDETA